MKTTMVLITIAVMTCFIATSPVFAEPSSSSAIAGGNTPKSEKSRRINEPILPEVNRVFLTNTRRHRYVRGSSKK